MNTYFFTKIQAVTSVTKKFSKTLHILNTFYTFVSKGVQQTHTKKNKTMKATHIYTEKFDTNRKLANRALKAMSDLQGYDNGTIRNPFELASYEMKDGRSLIQTIYEDGYVRFNDGFNIVEVDDYTMYVDFTASAIEQMKEYGEDVNYEYVYDEGLEPMQEEDEEHEQTENKTMTTVERWNILANTDLGSDVQPMAIQFAKFFERAASGFDQFDVSDLQLIVPELRGFQFNCRNMIILTTTCDLCHVTLIDDNAVYELETYLMDKRGWLDRYHYAINNKKNKKMKTFDNFDFWDLNSLYIHHYFKVGSKRTFYEFIDLAREFPAESPNYDIIIIGKNPCNGKYRVFKLEDLKGQKVVILNKPEYLSYQSNQS